MSEQHKHPEENEQDLATDEQSGSDQEQANTEEAVQGIEELKDELAKAKEQILRKVAEFENFRRRTREEQSQLVQYGNEGLIRELLPVVDDMERSLEAGGEHKDFESFFEGVKLLRNKFMSVLQARGLKPIETDGEVFNEEYHDAILQIPGSGKEPGAIIDEVERGYMIHDKVIRHSKVTVAADESGEE
ncbi:MAG: nucleotide exchange factor GrpE [Ectothiorhodospiraceae bacterium]|nr:nucleotide exchange factor GrpE [Ectothiorhodospiraceae bacterium]